MDHTILCRQLFKRYESGKNHVDAVRGLDLTVSRGECFGLLGPNGAGKTTTVEILEGLLDPTSGRVEVMGMQWGTGRDQEIRQQIGITLQETRFQEKLSVLEILTLFASFYENSLDPREVLRLVALQEKATAWFRELSGGQKQRLAVATSLVGDPDLFFLDEPTTGLDPQARRQLWDVIDGLKSNGKTILLTTHYMDEAEKLCDRVSIVDYGKVIAEGSPRELVAQLGGEHAVEFDLQEADSLKRLPPSELRNLDSVSQAVQEGAGFLLTVRHPHLAIPSLMRYLEENNFRLGRLTTRHVNLEDVFVSLTGRHLRDA